MTKLGWPPMRGGRRLVRRRRGGPRRRRPRLGWSKGPLLWRGSEEVEGIGADPAAEEEIPQWSPPAEDEAPAWQPPAGPRFRSGEAAQ